MSPRRYDLGRRREQIDDNRRRVIEAARGLLAETDTYTAFTVDAVAQRADVARATVYYQFGSKTGVLEALCDALAEAGHLLDLPAVFVEPDPLRALDLFILAFTRFWAADRLVMRRLRALAVLDAEVGAVIAARDQRHQAGLAVLISRLSDDAEGISPAQVPHLVQILSSLTSFETYDSLAGAADDPADIAAAVSDIADAVLSARHDRSGRATKRVRRDPGVRQIPPKNTYPRR